MPRLRIGCVVMAAGNAIRFGENKLSAIWQNKPLIRHALDAVPTEQFDRIVVVTQYAEVAELAKQYGFSVVENQHPDWGLSHTVALGIEAMAGMDAILFQVSDQPLLTRRSVADLVRCYRQYPHAIVALGHGDRRGNPCVFPRRFFPELLALEGDHGGSAVIRQHERDLVVYEVAAQQLIDVDTPEVLQQLKPQ